VPIVEREFGLASTLRILDCACGIGTQALGLATRGCRITACDLSPAAVERAGLEASRRGLSLQLFVADIPDLSRIPETEFDAVICLDNALPHLESNQQLFIAGGKRDSEENAIRCDVYSQYQGLRLPHSGETGRARIILAIVMKDRPPTVGLGG
jgi:SAM-dependent methyltransferase